MGRKDRPNIYILGEAGAGKNYLVDRLLELYPEYVSIKIAQPLYDVVELIRDKCFDPIVDLFVALGFDRNTAWHMRGEIGTDIINDVYAASKPRYALQKLGDIVRKYNEDALMEYALINSMEQCSIIEDVRLVREGVFLKDNGFTGIRIYATEEIRRDRLLKRDGVLYDLSHKTETQIANIPYEYFLSNNKDFHNFKDELNEIVMEKAPF